MKLIFIYGPPGVGKLTVAEELSKLTGYPVFHNHIAIDMVRGIYGNKNTMSEEMIHAVNLAAIKTMSMKRSDMIFTYSRPNDAQFIKEAVSSVESFGGSVLFVELKCSDKELMQRVRLRSDSKYSKITDSGSFRKFEKRYGPFRKIRIRNGITVDTTSTRPEDAALRISKALQLNK